MASTYISLPADSGGGGGGITQLIGDVTAGPGSGTVGATISPDAVTNAKLADMPDMTFKGNISGAPNNPTDVPVSSMPMALNFGDGSDGNATIAGPTTLTRSMFYNNLTINAGQVLTTGGYKIWVANTLTINGTILRNGNNGNTAGGSTGGIGGVGLAVAELGASGNGSGGTTGTVGAGTQSVAPAVTVGMGGNGGASGAGGAGSGGAGGALRASTPITYRPFRGLTEHLIIGTLVIAGGTGGSGGGAGGGDGVNLGRGGGGGGAGGGIIMIYAKNIIVNGTGVITAAGGNGGNAGVGGIGNTGGAGGGGGGGGGTIYLVYEVMLLAGSITVAGGSPGTGSAGAGTGAAGTNGASGTAGIILRWNTTTRVWE